MSEEVHNPTTVVPRILIQTILINGTLAFGFILVMLFCIGDIHSILHSPTGFPIIAMFYQATGSVHATTAMQSAITLIGSVSNIAVVASVSRLTWAFARDGGLPYSKFFAHVDGKYHTPLRAICLVCFTVVLLSLVNIASTTALSAILALTTSSLFISYIIPVVMMARKRIRKEPIAFGPFCAWPMGSGDQHLCYRLWRLYLYFRVISDRDSCDGNQYELQRASVSRSERPVDL